MPKEKSPSSYTYVPYSSSPSSSTKPPPPSYLLPKTIDLPHTIYVADRSKFNSTEAEKPAVLMLGDSSKRAECVETLKKYTGRLDFNLISINDGDYYVRSRAQEICIVMFFGEHKDIPAQLLRYDIVTEVDATKGDYYAVLKPTMTSLQRIHGTTGAKNTHTLLEKDYAKCLITILNRLVGFNTPEDVHDKKDNMRLSSTTLL